MCTANTIMRLYSNILHEDVRAFCLDDDILRSSVSGMKRVYSRKKNRLSSKVLDLADFDDAAYRCAYLHMYAPIHTGLVYDTLVKLFAQGRTIFDVILWKSRHIRLCSIGGGPGTDVVGSLAALHETFGYIHFNATVVDYMDNWRFSFYTLLQELRSGCYSTVGENADRHYFGWNYLCENLLKVSMSGELTEALSSADLVTMIKFLSAAACIDSEAMLQNIFRTMRPGAVILFIDNAAGGFHELMLKCAEDFGFKSLHGPVKHMKYSDRAFKVTRYGYSSCYETTVAVQVWQKPLRRPEPLPVPSTVTRNFRAHMDRPSPPSVFDRRRLSFGLPSESSPPDTENGKKSRKRKKKSNRNRPFSYFCSRKSISRSRKTSPDRRKALLPDLIPIEPLRRALLPLKNISSSANTRVARNDHRSESSETSHGHKRKGLLDCFAYLRSKRSRH